MYLLTYLLTCGLSQCTREIKAPIIIYIFSFFVQHQIQLQTRQASKQACQTVKKNKYITLQKVQW